MADVLLDDVSRVYPDGTSAVSHLTLYVRDGELLVIVGPSGCGKSTVLRLIAGLEPLSGGSVSIGGRVVDDVPPGGRDVAMVFETGALYPHLTASANLRFPLAARHLPKSEIDQRIGAESRVLRLGRFLDRKPHSLSAGERQRVAVGRATVRVPAVFLLDEPLTHLDAAERVRLRRELASMQRGLGVTAVYVTHDQAQAMAIGDRVAVMRAGRIEGLGGAVFPLCFALVRDHIPAARRPRAFVGISTVMSVGGAAGTVAAGPLLAVLSSRWLFGVPAIVSGFAAVAVWLLVVPVPVSRAGARIGWSGALLLASWRASPSHSTDAAAHPVEVDEAAPDETLASVHVRKVARQFPPRQ